MIIFLYTNLVKFFFKDSKNYPSFKKCKKCKPKVYLFLILSQKAFSNGVKPSQAVGIVCYVFTLIDKTENFNEKIC